MVAEVQTKHFNDLKAMDVANFMDEVRVAQRDLDRGLALEKRKSSRERAPTNSETDGHKLTKQERQAALAERAQALAEVASGSKETLTLHKNQEEERLRVFFDNIEKALKAFFEHQIDAFASFGLNIDALV
jgi:hypothetical protein